MKKLQLTDAVAAKAQITKKEAAAAVDAVLDVIAEALAAGEDVKITGFGGFEVKERAAREGVNPATGAKIAIAAAKVPAFKAAKALKDAVK